MFKRQFSIVKYILNCESTSRRFQQREGPCGAEHCETLRRIIDSSTIYSFICPKPEIEGHGAGTLQDMQISSREKVWSESKSWTSAQKPALNFIVEEFKLEWVVSSQYNFYPLAFSDNLKAYT